MKKLLLLPLLLLVVVMTGCGDSSKEKAVEDFAKNFGMMAKYGDVEGIKNVCAVKEDISSVSLDYNENDIKIFPQGDDKYKINYGNGAYIIVTVGLHNAIEVTESEGIINGTATQTTGSDTPAVAAASDGPAYTALQGGTAATAGSSEEDAIKKFAKTFKNNVKADKKWNFGYPDQYNSGSATIYVKNNNSQEIDGSDYYISFKYEYDYAEGMYSENVKQNGQNIPSNGRAKFNYHYTDDCSPGSVKVHFNLTDRQIYEKYGR